MLMGVTSWELGVLRVPLIMVPDTYWLLRSGFVDPVSYWLLWSVIWFRTHISSRKSIIYLDVIRPFCYLYMRMQDPWDAKIRWSMLFGYLYINKMTYLLTKSTYSCWAQAVPRINDVERSSMVTFLLVSEQPTSTSGWVLCWVPCWAEFYVELSSMLSWVLWLLLLGTSSTSGWRISWMSQPWFV
jgi:hypothetical protein